MGSSPENTTSDLKKLIDFFYSNTLYDFRNYAPKSLQRRLEYILKKYQLKSTSELITLLKNTSISTDEIVSEITVNVTELFRDHQSWVYLMQVVIPELYKRKDHINIWVAGCSTGEEAFTLSIILDELNKLEACTIHATDISQKAIEQAKSGVIKQSSFTNVLKQNPISNDYLTSEKGPQIPSKILNKPIFFQEDLVNKRKHDFYDLILCRNVLIYFNQTLQNNVVSNIYNAGTKDSFLFLGKNEALDCLPIQDQFRIINFKEKVYQKV